MAANYYSYFLLVLFVKETKSAYLNLKMPDDDKEFNVTSHLKFASVQKFCLNRDDACKSNNTNVCGVRKVNKTISYKEFKNACYLFMSNMCDHPAEEYFIISDGTCDQYLSVRRNNGSEIDLETLPEEELEDVTNSTDTNSRENETATEAVALRKGTTKFTQTPLYEIAESFDYHVCPPSCPRIYKPVCVVVNPGLGRYSKIMEFVNHCTADVYYCKNWREFRPPENEQEDVNSSPLDWTQCGSYKYINYVRFSETASSMGHYGWLAGEQNYKHIMKPDEKLPGYHRRDKKT